MFVTNLIPNHISNINTQFHEKPKKLNALLNQNNLNNSININNYNKFNVNNKTKKIHFFSYKVKIPRKRDSIKREKKIKKTKPRKQTTKKLKENKKRLEKKLIENDYSDIEEEIIKNQEKNNYNKINENKNQDFSTTNKSNNSKKKYLTGRWKKDEHKRFIDAIIYYGDDWHKVQEFIGTRTSTQARSHAQKFFEKLKKSKLLNFDVDFTKNSLQTLHDIMDAMSRKEFQKTLRILNNIAFERDLNNTKQFYEKDFNENYFDSNNSENEEDVSMNNDQKYKAYSINNDSNSIKKNY